MGATHKVQIHLLTGRPAERPGKGSLPGLFFALQNTGPRAGLFLTSFSDIVRLGGTKELRLTAARV